MHDIEDYRSLVFFELNSIPTFKESLKIWLPEARKWTQDFTDAHEVLSLGNRLRDLFQLTMGSGRAGTSSQSSVAKAGVAWESLVVWYLNLVFSGSRAVAFRKKASISPACVLDSIAVTYGNFQTNSESDVLVLVFPPNLEFQCIQNRKLNHDFFRKNIHEFELGIIQCKTSWADNAQIPMLWDMVYRLAGKHDHLSVGRNGYSISNYRKFTYSLIVAPTQKGSSIPTASKMPVKRVRNLSGGNYWGMPTINDVALSAQEIFTRNFGAAFDSNIPASIDAARRNRLGFFGQTW